MVMIRVTVWNENVHEKEIPEVTKLYPQGIHGELAAYLRTLGDIEVRTATLDDPDCGLTDEVLDNTDVMMWWGHCAHDRVPDEIARKVADRVLLGMGLIVMHSAHYSKPFRLLMGTTCSLRWRDGDFERVWCTNPGHPIAEGVPPCFELETEEMYGEFFDVPQPDEVVFTGWFRGGEVFRSGCCWHRGAGKVFYFQPGHETNTGFKNPHVLRILGNAVHWAKPVNMRTTLGCNHYEETTEQRYQAGEKEVY